jgi:Concanavalin A-like lectin/glucanases superfamily
VLPAYSSADRNVEVCLTRYGAVLCSCRWVYTRHHSGCPSWKPGVRTQVELSRVGKPLFLIHPEEASLKESLLGTLLFFAVTGLANAQTQPGVYEPNAHTLFYLPLDSPDAGAPEGCSINNASLLTYIADRFGGAAKAIHVAGNASASDFFFIECHNMKIATANPAGFTVGYWIRTTVDQLGDCSPAGSCSMRNLTILASNSDNGGCRKYVVTEIDAPGSAPSSLGGFPISCSSDSPGVKSTASISDGRWHSIIFVFDYTNKLNPLNTFYLDGVQNNQGPLPNTSLSASDFQAVAGAENGSFALNGDMDDLWVEDHAWSACEVDNFLSAAKHVCLEFPVLTDPACGGICTPRTAPISAVFDHWMHVPYECDSADDQSGWGQIEDFRGEMVGGAANRSSAKGIGVCHQLFGYTNGSEKFLSDVTYVGIRNEGGNQALQYDSHSGYDYVFNFVPVYAATSGCVSYTMDAPGESATAFHVLTIIPSDAEPVGGCANAISATGYLVRYLHLASFLENGVVKKGNSDGSNIVPCSPTDGCAQQNKWVPVNTPIGYSGNYASGWYDSKKCFPSPLQHPEKHTCGVSPHLHFEVDLEKAGHQRPVDPYGWHPSDPGKNDPYNNKMFNPGFLNITLWNGFNP